MADLIPGMAAAPGGGPSRTYCGGCAHYKERGGWHYCDKAELPAHRMLGIASNHLPPRTPSCEFFMGVE